MYMDDEWVGIVRVKDRCSATGVIATEPFGGHRLPLMNYGSVRYECTVEVGADSVAAVVALMDAALDQADLLPTIVLEPLQGSAAPLTLMGTELTAFALPALGTGAPQQGFITLVLAPQDIRTNLPSPGLPEGADRELHPFDPSSFTITTDGTALDAAGIGAVGFTIVTPPPAGPGDEPPPVLEASDVVVSIQEDAVADSPMTAWFQALVDKQVVERDVTLAFGDGAGSLTLTLGAALVRTGDLLPREGGERRYSIFGSTTMLEQN